jgi:hypothetical protein
LRRTALVSLFLVFLVACGGGGGGGPTEPTPTPTPTPTPQPSITFTPQGSAGANTLFLTSGAASTASTLVLEVRASQVTDLYGVAFDLAYPSTLLRFERATAGPLLGNNGSVQAAAAAGTLVVGGSHLGSVPGATGSGLVLTLEFSAVAAGNGTFAYSRNTAFNSTGDTITGIAWLAGSVNVTR